MIDERSEPAGQDRLADELVSELRELVTGLPDDARTAASVYETALVLFHQPATGDRRRVQDWLRDAQHADGGWCDPGFPKFRVASTLAAMLALQRADNRRYHAAIDAGCAFLDRQAPYWRTATLDDIPVGLEIIWPRLHAEAQRAGLRFSLSPPATLNVIGQARLAKLGGAAALPAGHPALHCWEAWGSVPVAASLGPEGSLAISPSATAAWLRAAHDHGLAPALMERAANYLQQAWRGSEAAVPGVFPYVWPLDVFECAYVLYSLGLGGLSAHPALIEPMTRAVAFLSARIGERGASFAAGFDPDGDTTSVAIAALSMAGAATSCRSLAHFANGDVYATCPGERNPSLSTTVHAMHALRLQHEPRAAVSAYVLAKRDIDGLWRGDKWHASPFFLTCHAVAALDHDEVERHGARTLESLLACQHANGGWAGTGTPNFEETAYAVLTIDRLCTCTRGPVPPVARDSLLKAFRWMRDAYYRSSRAPALWINKELSRPTRVVRAVELAGLWAAHRRVDAREAACC
ncbi:hypothetical protein WT27_24150 [Burkholderia territorii]|uniref:Squalene cyclase C-terminal domain-containing protein n=1 Tax=Burkholderia territorii TaxID=1503055 RepID=A0A105W0V7_9BURK|nr:prenyltransferase/squalene oxidase repeat-containing protein [Burkholderia territorii]KVV57571.1 hypothetical protein WT27_24150 [Burkholderia territorii]KVX29795.1 hypothetical protein WT31_11920 [Burkholderia territorii]